MKSTKTLRLLIMCCAITLAGCNSEKNKEKPEAGSGIDFSGDLKSGILTQYMDTTVKPGDDFMAYVNGKWMKETPIPADKAAYGVAYIVNEEAEENVRRIIQDLANTNHPKGSVEQKVGDLFSSYVDMEKRNALGVKPLLPEFEKIEALRSHDDLEAYFGYAASQGYMAPMEPFVYPDLKQPTQYVLYFFQSGLGMPEREYYLNQDERSKEIRVKYFRHLVRMFELAGMVPGDVQASRVMKVETEMAKVQMPKEETRDVVKLYNKYSKEQLQVLMPGYNWEAYLKAMGLSDQDTMVVGMKDYAKKLDALIPGLSMDHWKSYLKWAVMDAHASHLTEEMDQLNFEFYSKELRGVEQQPPLWRRGVRQVNNHLGEAVGKVYVERYFPREAKSRMDTLVKNLIRAYKISIESLDWMGEETRKEALDKLSKFNPKIGYPNKWRDYSKLDIEEGDLFGNMKRANQFEYQRQMNKLGKPIDRDEWNMNPQTVNAYYDPTKNEIVFPAGILQPPFFDLNAEDAVNYGAIGAVIGHEIGHGFDDQGSTFDGNGVLRNWWTDKDREEFRKRTSALVAQYNGYEVLDSVFVNGEFTLGENIGDLGGLGIALKAYELSLNGKPAPVIDGFTGLQRVFIGYAQSWRTKTRDEALRVQINTDPHAPAMFRVNGVVRNIPEFYKAFEVQSQDSLYLTPERRVKIW